MFKEVRSRRRAAHSRNFGRSSRLGARLRAAYDALLGADRADPADNLRLFAELIAEHGLFAEQRCLSTFSKVLNASELSVVRALYGRGGDKCRACRRRIKGRLRHLCACA